MRRSMPSKRCSVCKEDLPVSAFYPAEKGSHGVGSYCKRCSSVRRKEWQAKRRQETVATTRDTKKCSTCYRSLPLSEFYRNQYGAEGRQSCCKRCQCKKSKTWRKAHPEKVKATTAAWESRNKNRRKDTCLRRAHGLTLEGYTALFMSQDGLCAICRAAPTKEYFDVDHDHKTGAVRGLLCNGCNQGLGHFRDRPDLLKAAADYLQTLLGREGRPTSRPASCASRSRSSGAERAAR